ncbi:hypothetical protein IGI04_013892 [Brassica rapa subsp. trilocularis]|uniref:Uncharacterized protein n=1 Tax=Brassica rapa subsp. trilocularis TaxID=1813537 RepID=A0ABQ7NAS1_BRACM|nr:hypothetical protein IGI04_013892 [Brassica rapa subsp. trilocularis]
MSKADYFMPMQTIVSESGAEVTDSPHREVEIGSLRILEQNKLCTHSRASPRATRFVWKWNLCNTEKGRVCITETPGCLASVAELLDSDVTEEQENAISILLQLCVEKIEYCSLVVREGVDIYSSLFLISNNGTEEAKVGASELLRARAGLQGGQTVRPPRVRTRVPPAPISVEPALLRALEEVDSNSPPEGATTSQAVITPVKHQEQMLKTPSLKKSGLFGLRFPFSSRRNVC